MNVLYPPRGKAGEYAELACNLYRGCTNSCRYCYVPRVVRRKKEDFHATVTARKDILKLLERDAAKMAKTKDAGKAVHLCFTCDPYPAEVDEDVTRQAILILKRYGFGVQILTKAGSRARRDFDLLDGPNDSFGITLTVQDEALWKEWEPLAASPADRMATLEAAHRRGIKTWMSLEPVINPVETLKIIRETAAHVDLYKVGKLNYDPLADTIDWAKFVTDVTQLLDEVGKTYLIKDDLKKFERE